MVKGSRDTDTWIDAGLIGAKLRWVEHAPKLSKEKRIGRGWDSNSESEKTRTII